jgi:putative transposase
VPVPVRAASANAIGDTVIGTLHGESLDRVLILGRRHLTSVLAESIDHYNAHRPHRSLSRHRPRSGDSNPTPAIDPKLEHLRRAVRLGGLIHELVA